jgi:hypothetical protein
MLPRHAFSTGAVLLFASRAFAQAPSLPDSEPPPIADSLPPTMTELDERLRRTEELVLNRQPMVTLSGYVDFGFFAAQGNGAGYIQDFGHAFYPEYADRFGWVFVGDILSPAINSRGEVADLGDAPGVDRFDSVNSRGAPGFILNEANFTVNSALSTRALLTASFNLAPRTGSDFRLGDVFDLDLAQVEWLPTEDQRTSIFAGKIDSVIGIEYRDRKANKRFGVTPSLLARYTTGTALGVKLRSKFGPNDLVVVAVALTNGSNTTEQFHFYDEVDSNAGKTGSARLALRPPLPFPVEIGASGSWGPQDRSLNSRDAMWFFGPDLLAEIGGHLTVKAQWLKGKAPGNPADQVYGLDLHSGAYLELDLMINPTFGILGRGEYRDAFVWLGNERAYLTKSWRATIGGRVVLLDRAVLKAEYLRNGEYGGVPGVRNDVFTSSLVLSY